MNKVIFGIFIAVAAVSAHAEYLYWTVSGNETGYNNVASYLDALKSGGTISGADDVYARVVAKDASGNVVSTAAGTYGLTTEWSIGEQGVRVSMSDLLGSNYDNRSHFSYYVEIASSVSTVGVVGYNTEAQTYTALQTAGSITDSMAQVPTAQVWHGGSGSYKATPEPTSAMLMMLGAAMLGLRRKQRKLA